MYENGDEFSFKDICPEQGSMTEISAVEFTRKRNIVSGLLFIGGGKYNDSIYLVTNFPTGGKAFNWYRKRFRTETLFQISRVEGSTYRKSGLRSPTGFPAHYPKNGSKKYPYNVKVRQHKEFQWFYHPKSLTQ